MTWHVTFLRTHHGLYSRWLVKILTSTDVWEMNTAKVKLKSNFISSAHTQDLFGTSVALDMAHKDETVRGLISNGCFVWCVITTHLSFLENQNSTLQVKSESGIKTSLWRFFVWKCFISISSLLCSLFCCVRLAFRFVLRGFRPGVGWQLSCGLVLLWQFFCWRWSQDAHGRLTVTYDFRFGNKSYHNPHLLHHLVQRCVLWEKKNTTKNLLRYDRKKQEILTMNPSSPYCPWEKYVLPHHVDCRGPSSWSQSNSNMVLLLQPALHLFQLSSKVMSCDARWKGELFHLRRGCRENKDSLLL